MIPAAGRTRASDQTVWTTYHSFADGECVGGFIQRARKQWKERKNLRSASNMQGLQQLKKKKKEEEEEGGGSIVTIVKMGICDSCTYVRTLTRESDCAAGE